MRRMSLADIPAGSVYKYWRWWFAKTYYKLNERFGVKVKCFPDGRVVGDGKAFTLKDQRIILVV